MSKGPPALYGYSLFCDDLRREEGGKVTLVGVYSSEMIIFGSFPVTLPKLALIVTYVERPSQSYEPLELAIYFPGDADGEPSHRRSLPAEMLEEFRQQRPEPDAEDPILTMRLDWMFSPVNIKQEGRIKVRMIRGGTEIKLGTLRITTRSPSAAQAT